MIWEQKKLGDVISKILGGGTPSKSNIQYWGGNIPWCSVKDMADDKFQLSSTEDFITEDGLKNSASNLIPAGTVITATRMGLGRAFINSIDMAINQDLKAIFPNHLIDNKFLLWLVVSKKNELEGLGSGATVKGIRLETLKDIKISLPPLPIQKRIAEILSAYDDLIENNLKRIKLLEELAQRTYEEWFVKFRVNGEQLPIDDSTGLPVGWAKRRIEDFVCNYDNKRKPLSKMTREERKGNIPYYGAAGIIDHIDDFIFDGRYLLVGEDGTVINERGTALLQFIEGKFWVSNHAHVFTGFNGISTEHIFCFLNQYSIAQHITGAAQPKISQSNFNRIVITIADSMTLDRFDNFVKPIIDHVFNLKKQNQLLKESRDILLPRLMNGTINVTS